MEKQIYQHVHHPHQPRNTNHVYREEIESAGFNQRLAVRITKMTGTMVCAYGFAFLALLGFPALSTYLSPIVAVYVIWFSQTFLQLIFLPVLSVGQSVLNRKSELQAEEQFQTTQKSYHEIEQIVSHLAKQDEELLKQRSLLEALLAIQKGT